MVSTRRSRSAGGESEQIVSTHGSQEDVSSRHPAVPPLEPITEEPAAPTPARRRRGASQQQQQQHQQQQHAQEQQQQYDEPALDLTQQGTQQELQQQAEPATGQQPSQPPAIQQPSDDSSSEDDEEDDLDFDGPGVLQNLAAAIRSGFQSQQHRQTQVQQQQQQQQPTGPLQAAAAAAAAAARSSGRELNDEELQQLRWRPHTGLQLPAQAAAAVALVRPAHAKRGQRQQQLPQDEHVGALVGATPPAGAADSSSLKQQSGAAPAAAAALAGTKPQGLSKALHAPTLDAAARTKEAKKAAPDTAGAKWFDLPAPKITEELKRDLRVLRLRGAYDPKRFYKSFDNTKFPKYFAVGTMVDDPMDGNNRLSRGQRRATLTEQLLVDPELTSSRKRRFNKLQDEAQKWKKAKKRKTSQPRKTPSKHRPKH